MNHHTNLMYLWAALDKVPADRMEQFTNLLLAKLSVEVESVPWKAAIDSSMRTLMLKIRKDAQ